MQQNKRQILIGLVIVLALLQFVVKPAWHKQQQLHANLLGQHQQWQRFNRVLRNEASLYAADTELNQQLSELTGYYPVISANAGEFRLTLQQQLQQQLAQYQVDVTLFDWLSQQGASQDQVQIHPARLVLQGGALALMRGYTEVLAAAPGINVLQFDWQVLPSSGRGAAAPRATLTLLVNFVALEPGLFTLMPTEDPAHVD